jgi:hypothetical protein
MRFGGVEFLLDSDALIKLNKANLLDRIAANLDCFVPEAVYDEVVTRGRAFGYEDADTLEAILRNSMKIVSMEDPSPTRFGAGESAIVAILPEYPDAIVVSDDRRFVTFLTGRGVPFFTSVDVVMFLAEQDDLLVGG